jgi:glutathionyl-hydroquinone reductase
LNLTQRRSPLSVLHWRTLENGWTFEDRPGVIPDPLHGARSLHEVYTTKAQPGFSALGHYAGALGQGVRHPRG